MSEEKPETEATTGDNNDGGSNKNTNTKKTDSKLPRPLVYRSAKKTEEEKERVEVKQYGKEQDKD
jgi:hypothetical protein